MRRVAGLGMLAMCLGLNTLARAQAYTPLTPHLERGAVEPAGGLPDAPSAVQAADSGTGVQDGAQPCPAVVKTGNAEAQEAARSTAPCGRQRDPYQRFLNSPQPLPLTSREKGVLAVRDVIDPFNILTIVANSAFTIGIDSHTAYGPGLRGFGRNVGYSFVEDATGEFLGTYAVCSLVHQDPHYHRDPEGTTMHRIFHAVKHTFVSQHDDGRPMLNIENLFTYPASAEIENLYVPGVAGNGPSTVARIATGLATDPVSNLITEFLPDFAKRVHIHVVFVQQILNQVATGQPL